MIYLTTGTNGAGKTLRTLRDVRDQQLRENRPVYYHGFEALQPIVDFGWLPFDPKKWQDLPDGSICIMDECQNEFPARKSSQDLPDYINAIAQFRRKRGFDFWMVTPHPMMIDKFIRQLIERPSWHRHLKRTFGADLVSSIKWSNPNINCEKPNSGATGEVTMLAFPKEVYTWYKSASLHTGKKKIPKQVYVLGALAVLIPAMIYFAYGSLMKPAKAVADKGTTAQATQQAYTPRSEEKRPMTSVEYAASVAPRFEGLPQTAPRYDEINRAQVAPKPAACLDGFKPGSKVRTCSCWTQQATPLHVPLGLCQQIAAGGFFDDTLPPPDHGRNVSKAVPAGPAAPAVPLQPESAVVAFNAGSVLPPPDTRSTISRDAETLAFMAKRRQHTQ